MIMTGQIQAKEAYPMSVTKLNAQSFDQEVLHSNKPVLVDFLCYLVRAVQGLCADAGRRGAGV